MRFLFVFSRGRAVRFIQPLREIFRCDFVVDWDVCHPDLDGVQSLSDSGGPVAYSDGHHSKCYGLVESFRSDAIQSREAEIHIL
jgi:hypothetical protein